MVGSRIAAGTPGKLRPVRKNLDDITGPVEGLPSVITMDERSDGWLVVGLLALAAGLAVNSLVGPLVAGIVTYPLSETLMNQTIGLEAVTLVVVAPWSIVAAVAVHRNHPAGPVLGMAPSAYAAYMFLQYIVGPEYVAYPTVLPLHLAIFVLSWIVLLAAWNAVRPDTLPPLSRRRRRVASGVLFLLAAFVVSRYVASFQGVLTGGTISAEYLAHPSMYWSIYLLDLGVVVPATVGTAVGLLRETTWAKTALYGLVGWYVLVPVSVSAMSIVMFVNDDPHASVGNVFILSVVAVVFVAFTAWLYRPLLR